MYPSQLPPGVSRWRSLTLNAEHEDVDLDLPPHVSVYGDMYVCQESAVLERVERMLSFVVEEPDTPAHIRERATLALSEVRRRRQRVTQLIQMATEHQQRRAQSTRVKLSEPQHPGGEEPVTAEAAAWTITEAIKDLAKHESLLEVNSPAGKRALATWPQAQALLVTEAPSATQKADAHCDDCARASQRAGHAFDVHARV